MDKTQDDRNWVKIALKVNRVTHLTKLDVGRGVEDILRQICQEHGICYEPGKYALKVNDFRRLVGTDYLTEENKTELRHGRQLKLSKSPAEKVSNMINRLHRSRDRESSLRHLTSLESASRDSVILRELHAQNAIQNLRVFASVRDLSPDECCKHYKVIGHLLAENYLPGLNADEVEQLTWMIGRKCQATREMLLLSFELLILLRKRGKLSRPGELLRELPQYVRSHEDRKLQERSLHLINYLYLFARDPRERNEILNFMKSPPMITHIVGHVIGERLSNSMKHQLYLYQTIILSRYRDRLEMLDGDEERILKEIELVAARAGAANRATEATSDEAEARERNGKSEEEAGDEDRFQRIVCSLRASLKSARSRSTSGERDEKFGGRVRSSPESASGSGNDFPTRRIHFGKRKSATWTDETGHEEELKGIHDELDHAETAQIEASEEGISALTLDNLCHYVMNDFRNFEELLLVHEKDLKPILRVGVEITNLLCRLFEIQKTGPGLRKGRFVPLCFVHYDRVIERLFGISLKLFHKTRQEMRVAIDSSEYPIVFKTVEEKLLMALDAEPAEFQQLEANLNQLGLDVVLRRREEAIREDIERVLTCHPGFVQLREIIAPKIMEEIQEKRLRFMKAGEHAPRFDYKGQRMGEKMWFIYVPGARDKILIQECSTNPCTRHHKTLHSVSMSDIREVEHGIKSNFHKEVYFNLYTERDMFFRAGMKPQELAFEFPISLKLKELCYVDFCAGSALSMDYWVDGINFLIGEKMSSETTTQEFNHLLDIQLMSRLAELEGLEIPEEPPAVPAPPANYDFALT